MFLSNAPVLLFGMPRSGTTWLGKIFDSHPSTLYRHEPDSVRRISSLPLLAETFEGFSRAHLRKYCEDIATERHLKVVGKAPVFAKHYMNRGELIRYRFGIGLSRLASKVGYAIPVFGTPSKTNDDTRIVWKSIESLGRLGLFLDALPDARVIHIVRHPCGYVASVERGERRNKFDGSVATSEDYELMEALLKSSIGRSWGYSIDDIRDMAPEERLAWRWSVFNDKALADSAGNDHVLAFSYESLCDEPIDVARSLIEHAALDWNYQVEEFVVSSTEQVDKGYYSVYKNPADSARSWKRSLDAPKVQRILSLVSRSTTWNRFEFE